MSPEKRLDKKPKIIFFTDFDGTISITDSNDVLVSHLGYGEGLLNQSNLDVLEGRVSLREAFVEQMHSIDHSLKDCIDFQCKHIQLDPHFAEFYWWAKESNVPIIVLSGGLEPMIRALLEKLLGSEAAEIEIISNLVVFRDGSIDKSGRDWMVQLHDDSLFGLDKSVYIREYATRLSEMAEEERPALIFAGDGVSDICAARECEHLFAKRGRDLVTYCVREGIPFIPFENWKTIHDITKVIRGTNPISDAKSHSLNQVPKE